MAYRFNEFFLSEFQAYVNSKKIPNHSKRFQLATSHIVSDRKSFLRVHTFYDCGRKKKKNSKRQSIVYLFNEDYFIVVDLILILFFVHKGSGPRNTFLL